MRDSRRSVRSRYLKAFLLGFVCLDAVGIYAAYQKASRSVPLEVAFDDQSIAATSAENMAFLPKVGGSLATAADQQSEPAYLATESRGGDTKIAAAPSISPARTQPSEVLAIKRDSNLRRADATVVPHQPKIHPHASPRASQFVGAFDDVRAAQDQFTDVLPAPAEMGEAPLALSGDQAPSEPVGDIDPLAGLSSSDKTPVQSGASATTAEASPPASATSQAVGGELPPA